MGGSQTFRPGYAFAGLAAALLVVAAEAAGGADAAGSADVGRGVADKWCARCHVVGPQNPYGSIEMTPSFFIFARKPGTYPPARIRSFSERPPHPQFEFKVSEREMDDLIAYIATLKPE